MKPVSADARPVATEVRTLCSAYFEGLSAKQYAALSDQRKQAVVASHAEVARSRGSQSSVVRVVPAGVLGAGPALQIVSADMPHLVDAVLETLSRSRVEPELIVHPVLELVYGSTGIPVPASENTDPEGVEVESWIHIGLHESCSDDQATRVMSDVSAVLDRIARVHGDSEALACAAELAREQLLSAGFGEESEFLSWCIAGNFGFAGCVQQTATESMSLGVLPSQSFTTIPRSDDSPITVGIVHLGRQYGRSEYVTAIDIRLEESRHRFVGSFTATGEGVDVRDVPLVRDRVGQVLSSVGYDADSYIGQAMLAVVQSIPLAEILMISPSELSDVLDELTSVEGRRSMHAFMRSVGDGREIAVLLFVPREKFSTTIRITAESVLASALGAENVEFSSRVSESPLAVVHFTATVDHDAEFVSVRRARELRDRIVEACLTWDDRFLVGVTQFEERNRRRRFADRLPQAYKQDFDAARALADMSIIADLEAGSVDLRLSAVTNERGSHRLSLFVAGAPLSLGEVLPALQSFGIEVLDERPYLLSGDGDDAYWIYEFTLKFANAPTDRFDEFAQRLAAAFVAVHTGRAEADPFNELIALSGLNWRQVVVLRAYSEFLQQARFPYSASRIAEVLCAHPGIAAQLIEFFVQRFDPEQENGDSGVASAVAAETAVAHVSGLDADRILRGLLGLIRHTLRTNYFVRDELEFDHLSLKFDSSRISELPEPRPKFEIFVYSPSVAGVHLRFGSVARGGLRWSDRKEDYRTEVLGLVKAQAVKNAVIVPVGAKGGFVVKRPPLATGVAEVDREALLASGISNYRTFIGGLLDVTDNVDSESGTVLPAPKVVRHDADDTYLVVAADKGTAKFSDIANDVAAQYDFWLGDAFASGGSVGYDHKAMGITARGAWESVRRHFRELGVDTQTEDFTVVGIGDMSGDVFGNGMLCSRKIRLIAAFDHRHIFVDPDPSAGDSFEERSRLFALPRSSWADYDSTMISSGGGVWDRSAKSVPISAEMRAALGLDSDVTAMTPPELVRVILRAPVDLLWNGGIGTYVKCVAESDLDVGDKSNDSVRVNGNELRVRVVGEGGNLGLTQAGRIEFARTGGRINTDALDNSAGVDCSDHEVNIKVLVDGLIALGSRTREERSELLASMADEVSALVLADNHSQNELMGTTRADCAQMLGVHSRLISSLEAKGSLDRRLEVLPTKKEVAALRKSGLGLSSPELATLTAHIKLDLKAELLQGDLIDNPVFLPVLVQYFPEQLRDHCEGIVRHPLRREIIATVLTNEVVDRGGITYVFRLGEEIGARPEDAVRAFTIVTAVFGLRELWAEIRDARTTTDVSDELILLTRRLLDRASRWMLTRRPQPLAVGAEILSFRKPFVSASELLREWMVGSDLQNLAARSSAITEKGAPETVVHRVELLLDQFGLLDVVEISDRAGRDIDETGSLYFRLSEYVGLVPMLNRVSRLSKDGRWNALARLSLRDELYATIRALTLDVLNTGAAGESTESKLAGWEVRNAPRIERSRLTLAEIEDSGERDLAALSVATSQLRRMVNQ